MLERPTTGTMVMRINDTGNYTCVSRVYYRPVGNLFCGQQCIDATVPNSQKAAAAAVLHINPV